MKMYVDVDNYIHTQGCAYMQCVSMRCAFIAVVMVLLLSGCSYGDVRDDDVDNHIVDVSDAQQDVLGYDDTIQSNEVSYDTRNNNTLKDGVEDVDNNYVDNMQHHTHTQVAHDVATKEKGVEELYSYYFPLVPSECFIIDNTILDVPTGDVHNNITKRSSCLIRVALLQSVFVSRDVGISICKTIGYEDARRLCAFVVTSNALGKQGVVDKLLEESAMVRGDMRICDAIKSSGSGYNNKANLCKARVVIKQENVALCDTFTDDVIQFYCRYGIARNTHNANVCADIRLENKKMDCFNWVK